ERRADRGTQPVRGLVVEVISKPQLGRGIGLPLPVAQKPRSSALPHPGEVSLALRLALAVIAAQPRGHKGLVPGTAQRGAKQLCDAPVARRQRMIGWLQRRIKRNPHGVSIYRAISPPPPASGSAPAAAPANRTTPPARQCRPPWRTLAGPE